MYADFFNEFLVSGDTLRVYEGNQLIFSSTKDRLLPLLEYIDRFSHGRHGVVMFDRILGNAAALLAVEVSCREVYSPLGSQHAVKTLEKYGIGYHITEIVSYIQKPDGEDMCPMERLSMNKEPEEFHEAIRVLIK